MSEELNLETDRPIRRDGAGPDTPDAPAARDDGRPASVEVLLANPFFAQFTAGMVTGLAPECPPERGVMLAERLCRKLAEARVETEQGAVSFTVSIGVTDCPPEAPIEDHLERADRALYRAKNQGRNRVVRA